jgi:murein L,D-transpeptidase YcbB/YkuD
VRSALADDAKLKGVAEADRTALTDFYNAPDAKPLWVTPDGLSDKGKTLIGEIRKADDWGLSASSFDVPDASATPKSPEELADAERRISVAALRYARFARGGRFDPGSLIRSYDQNPPVRDPKVVISELATASAPDKYLRDQHPKHEQFVRLRKALLALRAEEKPADPAEAARHVTIPRGPALRPGADNPNVALLRKRLDVAAEADNENIYDDALVEAVKAFQTAHGLQADGIVGGGTRNALNGELGIKPNKERDIARILVNMERWRWMPEHLGHVYVWDNLPEFMTHVMKDGKSIFSEKIVVGLPNWPTPVFSAPMKYIVFNPSWGMPDGIKQKELLPRLRKYSSGGNFFEEMFGGGPNAADVLEAQDLIVSYNGRQIDPNSVNWSQVNIRAFSFTQPPGPRNVLGRLKFMFPNKHDVYMHDTVQKDLFARSVRNYSHGCMRVQNPLRFAQVILGEDKGWSAEQVESYYRSSASNEVRLDKSIPVHVTYFTAVVDDDGTVKTYGDIYGHDSRISSALGKPYHFEAPRGGGSDAEEVAYSGDDARPRRKREARNVRKQRQPQTLSDIFSSLYGP